jgi:RNA polymerase sigma factor (TIGR02999 family)
MPGSDVTELLEAWTGGNRAALDALMPVVIDELKRIAGAHLAREPNAQTFQPTALVNEAYLRLVRVRPDSWESRSQFFALCAQLIRRILVDHARARNGAQRGGGLERVPFEEAAAPGPAFAPRTLVSLDEALAKLKSFDARKSRIVELRIFGGLGNEETASVLGLSSRTVIRDWQFAKAWLGRELDYALPAED